MRYSVPDPIHFEEATPRGLLTIDFAAGECEPEDDSDERFVLEHRLIPDGLASRVAAKKASAAPAPAPVKE